MNEPPLTRFSLLAKLHDPDDQESWCEFVEIYEPLIYRKARRRGLQHADAADLCQEVFSKIATAIDHWDPDPGRGAFRAWLFTIARNLTIDRFSRKHRPQTAGASSVIRLADSQSKPPLDESAEFDLEYHRQIFRWAADRVQPEFQEKTWKAFWMTAVDNLDTKSTASALGISTGAVYIARSRVMARLRAEIERLEGKSEAAE